MQLAEKFRELEQTLLHDRRLVSLWSGVPFLMLVYAPEDERICRELQAELMEKLRARGMPVVEHRLDTFIFEYYERRLAKRGGLQALFDLERENPDEARRTISRIYGPELVKRILTTAERAEPNGAIFLTGVATMYPFGRISSLLTDLENKVTLPLVVFYPGSNVNGQLSFLNREIHTGYRARVI